MLVNVISQIIKDIWYYFIKEIINPDQSISNQYLNKVNKKFLYHFLEQKNNLNSLKLQLNLEIKNKNKKNIIHINYKNKFQFKGSFQDIPDLKIKNKIIQILKKYKFNISILKNKNILIFK